LTNHHSNTDSNTSTTNTNPGGVGRTDSLVGQGIEPDRWWMLSTVDTAATRARCRSIWRSDTPNPASVVVEVIGHVPMLCDEIERLARLLAQARYAYANLTAAARAALSARAEGEVDPWWYLCDELGEQPPATPGGAPGVGTGTGTGSAGAGCGGWCW
jgi:hypothetical protein